jgi:uncharacterized repeat protein (TIGR01451 family)
MGSSIAIDGNAIVVGAPECNDNGDNYGSVRILERSGPEEVEHRQKLTASDGKACDRFGASVAIESADVLIGAPGDATSAGSAYVFASSPPRNEQQKLTASDGQAGDGFGSSVGISGDTAVAGAPGDDDNGLDSGSAYLFERDGTTTLSQQQKLTAADGEAGDRFGSSVAISGERAVVGAPGDDDNGADAGAAYVFVRNGSTWSQEQKLTPDDGSVGAAYGSSVSINGDRLVVGSPQEGGTGAAYVYLQSDDAFVQQDKLTPSSGAAGDAFGSSVDVNGDQVVVGSPGTDGNGADSGSAHVYGHDGSQWMNLGELTNPDGAAGDAFGSSVATDGGTSVVGAPNVDSNAISNAGQVYSFLVPRSDLSIVKSAPAGHPPVGETLTYAITVTNNGPETSTDATVEDQLPAGVGFLTATASQGTCSEQLGKVTCEIGGLAPGGSADVTVQATVNAEGPLRNTAKVNASGFDPDEANNTATIITIPAAGSFSSAIVDIDAKVNSHLNKISLPLPAGTYKLTVVGPDQGGRFKAWNAWFGAVDGCVDGSDCRVGWMTQYAFSSPSLGTQVVESHGRFEDADLALAAVTDGTLITLPTAQTVQLWNPDCCHGDNLEGVSVRIVEHVAVSVPSMSWAGLIILAAALAGTVLLGMRRRHMSHT